MFAGKTVAVQMLNVEGWNIPCSDPDFHSSLNCRQQTLVQQPDSPQQPGASMLQEEERNPNIIPLTSDQFRSVGAEILIGCWVHNGRWCGSVIYSDVTFLVSAPV